MKTFFKRYRVFLILFFVNIIVGLVIPDIGIKSLSLTKQNLMY